MITCHGRRSAGRHPPVIGLDNCEVLLGELKDLEYGGDISKMKKFVQPYLLIHSLQYSTTSIDSDRGSVTLRPLAFLRSKQLVS